MGAYAPLLRSGEVDELLQRINDAPFDSFETTIHGIRIVYQLDYSGYYAGLAGSMLVPMDGKTPSCTMVFTMEKVS